MRHSFAIVAAAAIANNAFATTEAEDVEARANEFSCETFKAFVFANRAEEGWTAEENGDSIIYKDNGNVIDDWSGFEGYEDTGCVAIDQAKAAAAGEGEEDGAAYLSFGAAIVATGAALAF